MEFRYYRRVAYLYDTRQSITDVLMKIISGQLQSVLQAMPTAELSHYMQSFSMQCHCLRIFTDSVVQKWV
jgi:phosphoribosyl 1,2-cyclic phosphodiesterase